MASHKKTRSDLRKIRQRLKAKNESYARYNFSQEQNALLRAFFDLAQEFDSLEDFYRICVAALDEFLRFNSRLYLLDQTEKYLYLVCESTTGIYAEPPPAPDHIRIAAKAYEVDDSYVVPIYRKPVKGKERCHGRSHKQVVGLLEVYPAARLSDADRFFIEKYTNRIGYNLHNRTIAQQNIRHLKFINNLVMDIEHNVITPNMYFKHLFNQLKKSIADMEGLEKSMQEFRKVSGPREEACAAILQKLSALNANLRSSHKELTEHHANYSLFLESLFRRDHFAQGHFVLHPKECSIEKDIITPQLDHCIRRFEDRGIAVEWPKDRSPGEIPIRVDVGLLSQVYANLFSNAVKYTSEIIDHRGTPRKVMSYGYEVLPEYFGPGRDGVKFNVFTTGRHLPAGEADRVFFDGFRGGAGKSLPGTGHGLAFIKQVIEIHGGEVGYESTEEGNNFYFILPLPTRGIPDNTTD